MTPAAALAFYTALAVWLTGFALAAVTAGATGAVVTGTLGLLATLAAIVLRIEAAAPRTGRDRTRRWPR